MTNEVLNTMKTRRSCRCYLDKMPEPEALNAVLEAGTWAPTGMGRQSPVIVCIQNKADRDTLSKMNAAAMGGNGDPFYGAPCVAVVPVDKALMLLAAALPIALVGYFSAIAQGKCAAGSMLMVGRRPEMQGKGMMMTAMVETYAVLALLISFLCVNAIVL